MIGESGSGKSSLVRAGMLPALYGGFLAGAGSDWRIAVLRPGGDPIGNLAAALAEALRPGRGGDGRDPGSLPRHGGGQPAAQPARADPAGAARRGCGRAKTC